MSSMKWKISRAQTRKRWNSNEQNQGKKKKEVQEVQEALGEISPFLLRGPSAVRLPS